MNTIQWVVEKAQTAKNGNRKEKGILRPVGDRHIQIAQLREMQKMHRVYDTTGSTEKRASVNVFQVTVKKKNKIIISLYKANSGHRTVITFWVFLYYQVYK